MEDGHKKESSAINRIKSGICHKHDTIAGSIVTCSLANISGDPNETSLVISSGAEFAKRNARSMHSRGIGNEDEEQMRSFCIGGCFVFVYAKYCNLKLIPQVVKLNMDTARVS